MVEKYQFFKLNEAGELEIYADHHMLSSLRTCEGYFEESILNSTSTRYRSWSLEFGQWIHSCLEFYYTSHMKKTPVDVKGLVSYGNILWLSMDMDYFSKTNTKQCKSLGGSMGAAGLLGQYFTVHNDSERLRTVACEVGFGKHKEVYIGSYYHPSSDKPVHFYLTGRIDRIVDNGDKLSPFDHKSASYFKGAEMANFTPHEGMQGYVFALQQIMAKNFPHLAEQGKICDSIVINHISVTPTTNPYDRFKRSTISYSPAQMEAWRKRQMRSFKRLFEIVVLGETADWNTQTCSNMYHHECPFKALHEQDAINRDSIFNQKYVKIAQWNPYDPDANLTQGEREAQQKAEAQVGIQG